MSNLQTTKWRKERTANYPMSHLPAPHPNEIDLRRIERLLEQRVRYRYVSPVVQPIDGGYQVMSPCCSRNIDAGGGMIDIARIEFIEPKGEWRLYHRDHRHAVWKLYTDAPTLQQLITCLNEDPMRVFWQ